MSRGILDNYAEWLPLFKINVNPLLNKLYTPYLMFFILEYIT